MCANLRLAHSEEHAKQHEHYELRRARLSAANMTRPRLRPGVKAPSAINRSPFVYPSADATVALVMSPILLGATATTCYGVGVGR